MTSPSQVTMVDRLNSQPIRSCTTKNYPTHILHPTPWPTCALLARNDRQPILHSCSHYSVSNVPVPTYLEDILSFELSIALKCGAATKPFNIPVVTSEHQSSDDKPHHTVTMHNPIRTVQIWNKNKIKYEIILPHYG